MFVITSSLMSLPELVTSKDFYFTVLLQIPEIQVILRVSCKLKWLPFFCMIIAFFSLPKSNIICRIEIYFSPVVKGLFCFRALQIFSKEAHPSVYKSGGSGSKEGLSLFGTVNFQPSRSFLGDTSITFIKK